MAETPPERFLAFLRDVFRPGSAIDILEVGGGSVSYIDVPGARYTVLDPDPASVARNGYADEVVIGDAQTFDIENRRFDAIVFWNVLEHVDEPERAVTNIVRALKPGGLLIVRGPMIRSLKALVTRFTPHWFHVAFYRTVLGHTRAGEPGHAPFPTALARGADADMLIAALAREGLSIRYEERYIGDQVELLRSFSSVAHKGYEWASAALRALSGARWGSRESEFVLVFERAHVPSSGSSAPMAEPALEPQSHDQREPDDRAKLGLTARSRPA